jgi:2-oxoglutarate ferredoxin oxidoreductase subunit beta
MKVETFKDIETIYCAGCFHGLIHRIIGEVIDKNNLREEIIGVNTHGCSSFISDYMNMDFIEAPPGFAPSIASGIKNVNPDKLVITYQGDGDLLSFGMSELIHCASKGEKITVILINNLVMAQTGGQISPLSLVGQVTETSPYGRSLERHGKNIKISELVAKLSGSAYVARVTVDTPERIEQAKKVLNEAFSFQIEGKGFTFVEFISLCPPFWNKSPLEAKKWLQESLINEYPIGVLKKTITK